MCECMGRRAESVCKMPGLITMMCASCCTFDESAVPWQPGVEGLKEGGPVVQPAPIRLGQVGSGGPLLLGLLLLRGLLDDDFDLFLVIVFLILIVLVGCSLLALGLR